MWSEKVANFTDDFMYISGEKVSTKKGELAQGEIKFWQKNPRIYSIVHSTENTLDQDEIEMELQSRDHVKQLIKDIRHHGGLIDPIVVVDKTFEVIEGNSRLAAIRFLSSKDPIRFSAVRCIFLPERISESAIYSYLNQEHIQGKTHWSPYEQAGVIYRLVSSGKDIDDLKTEMNISRQKASKMYDVYSLMVAKNEDKPNRFSYYDVYLSCRKAKEKRSVEPTLDDRIVAEVKSEKFTAQEFRTMLPIVCNSPKAFTKFISGRTSFLETYESLEEQGKTDNLGLLLKKMMSQLQGLEKSDFDGLTATAHKDCKYRLDRMMTLVKNLRGSVYGAPNPK